VEYWYPADRDPQNQLWVLRAQQQLARLHRDNNDYELALAIYDRLAALDATEEQFRAVGWAGQAICHWHLDQRDQASDALLQVLRYLDAPYLEDMREELNRIGEQLHQGARRAPGVDKRPDMP
jgi:tetratricopeptide (TPR) repeat protein